MAFAPGLVTVTLLSPASPTLAADLGLTPQQNVAGAVLHLPARDARALVQAGVAEFGTDIPGPAAPVSSGDAGAAELALLQGVLNPTKTALTVSGTRDRFRDGFTTGSPAQPVDPAVWTLVNETPDAGDGRGHLVLPGGDSQGAAYLRVSLSPFAAGSAVHLASKTAFSVPIRHAWGISISQRNTGQEVIFGLTEGSDTDSVLGLNRLAQPADLPIVGTVTTNGTVQTMTVTNHGLKGNDRVLVIGNTEKRLDVGPVYVTVVDANTITVPNAVAAATYPAGGVVRVADPTALVSNAAVQLWGDTATATNSTFASRRNGTKYRTVTAQNSQSSTPIQINANPYSDAWLAQGPCEIWANIDEVVWRSWGEGTSLNAYAKFQQSIPDETASYRLYARAKNLDNLSRPIARITSITKTASSTATVTTDVPHGLVVGDIVSVTGVRDQASFGTFSGATLTVPSATTFTASFGLNTTATGTDGTVWLNRGNVNTPGMLTQVVQNLTKTGSVLALTGTSTWAGVSPGDYVQLHGTTTSAAGNNFDGAYKVQRLNGTTLELAYTGTLPDQATYNTGGTVIRRTDVRMHFARILGHTRLMTEVIGGRGGTTDGNNSVPVSITASPTLTMNAVQILTAAGEGAPATATAITAGGTFTGSTVDAGSSLGNRQNAVRCVVMHNVANFAPAVLSLEQSTDNTTWRETHRVPVPSDGVYHTFDLPLTHRYTRVKLFNGGNTTQSAVYLAWTTFRGEPTRDENKVLTFPLTAAGGQALALSTTFTGPTIDLGPNHTWNLGRMFAYSDQASAANGVALQQSMDGAAGWYNATSAANTAAGGAAVEEKITCRYLRAIYVNGATAATNFRTALTLVSL